MILYAGNILSKYGYTPTFIELLTPKLSEHYNIKAVSDKKKQLFRLWDMINNFLKNKSKIKLVLIDSYSRRAFWYTYILAKLCVHYKIPYMPILSGGAYPNRLKKSPRLCKIVFSNSKLNISPSLYLKKHFEDSGYDVKYIPNFIPIENYEYKQRVNIRPKLLWVRSFHEIYNPLLAIEILYKLKNVYSEAELCMVGPDKGGTLQRVLDKAKKLGVKDSLKITGKLSKKEWLELSKNYDIFINTTDFDNHPISVLEGMALGLPVASTNVGGIPFLIEDKVDGILIPPNDAEEFFAGIDNLIKDNALVLRITKNARNKVEKFDWEILKYKWFDTIDNVLNLNKN